MFDDEEWEKREREIQFYLQNKIKRCQKCGNELNYTEKYHFSDKVCCACKGLSLFDEPIERTPLELPASEPEHQGNENMEGRTEVEHAFYKRYPDWQMRNEQAEQKWRDTHPADEPLSFIIPASDSPFMVSIERINQLMAKYDAGEPLDVRPDELISLFWEILYHRKINAMR